MGMNAYFFDMDGTLYNNQFHEVSEKTFAILNQLQSQNHFVALATSRCHQELKHLPSCMRHFPFDRVISDGGSLIVNQEGKIVDMHPIPEMVMQKIIDFCQRENVMFRYSTIDGDYFGTPYNQFAHNIYFKLYLTSPVFKPYAKDEVLNVILFCHGEVKKRAKLLFQDLSLVDFPNCFEIRAEKINKASAIQTILNRHAFDKVYCFGDGANDVEMLKLADIGVAMGNACEALKAVSDIVIDRVDKDGIYKFLKEEEEKDGLYFGE